MYLRGVINYVDKTHEICDIVIGSMWETRNHMWK